MADALFEMEPETEDWQLNRKCIQDGRQWWDVSLVSDICIGYLPLPKDASSPAVAETAGKWLSRCSAEDVAAVIRHGLAREDVRKAVIRLRLLEEWDGALPMSDADADWLITGLAADLTKHAAQEPTND